MRTGSIEGGWVRTDAAEELKERLRDPVTVQKLVQLLDRLDTLDRMLSLSERVVHEGPAIAGIVADTVDELYRSAGIPGLELQQRAQTALELARKLTQPSTAQSLNRLLDQLQTVERSLEAFRTLVENGPGVVGALADTLDEFCRQAGMSAVDLDLRVQKGLQLLGKLTQPATLEALGGLVAKAQILEQSTGLLGQLIEKGPGLAAMAADTVDELYRDAAKSGIDVQARLEVCLEIARKVTDPRLLQAIRNLLDHPGAIEKLGSLAIQLAEQGPYAIAALTDIVDEWCRSANQAGINVEVLRRRTADLGTQLLRLFSSGEFETLIHSGILEPKTLQVLGSAGQALALSQREGDKRLSRFGLVRAMGDPDVQRAVNFFISFARRFGQSLSSAP